MKNSRDRWDTVTHQLDRNDQSERLTGMQDGLVGPQTVDPIREDVLEALGRRGSGPLVLADLILHAGPHVDEVMRVLQEFVGNHALNQAQDVLQTRQAAASGTPSARQAAADSPTDTQRWTSGSSLQTARALPDAELTTELDGVRRALSRRSSLHTGEPKDRDALRTAQTELEFEARRRTALSRTQSGKRTENASPPLDSLARPGELSLSDEHAGRTPEAVTARSVALRKLDYAIATRGLDGAEHEIQRLETEATEAAGPIHAGSHESAEPMTWLRHELALRKTEGEAFLERFELVGRSISLALLRESGSRLQTEIARYGLRQGVPHSDGSLTGMGLALEHGDSTIADLIAHGRAIRAAHDRASTGGKRELWHDFERTKAMAIAAHPILATFVAGTSRLEQAAPTGLVPDALELGKSSPELMAGMVGWELNRKLLDNRATTERIESGKLSIFGAPRIVELTKLEMRVADGMMLSGVVDERVRNPSGAPWTDALLSAITVALGLLLAAPTGGASMVSAGVGMAGSLALLAADLALLGSSADERDQRGAAANSDVLLQQALLDEEPAAAPLLHQLLGGLGMVGGVAGVFQGAAHLHVLAQARQGVADIKSLRRTLMLNGGDAALPQVQAAADQLRLTAREAGLTSEQTEAMIRTTLRSNGQPMSPRVLEKETDAATGRAVVPSSVLAPASEAEAANLVLQEIERAAGGLRRPALETLDPDEIAQLQREFSELGGDPAMLEFNRGRRTGYDDEENIIQVCGDVRPLPDSLHPRSAMSSKAVLGHELGHAAHRGTKLPVGAWNDEFRASYWAAKNLQSLSDEERIHLILDAMERAREAGVSFVPNKLMRKVLYGY